jgi:hypothetical protein
MYKRLDIVFLIIMLSMNSGKAGMSKDQVGSLYVMPQGVETRWANAENFKGEKGRAGMANDGWKGSPCIGLDPNQSKVLAEVHGTSGTIRRIWITPFEKTPEILRGIVLEMYWDDDVKPAVSVPLGDFFCNGLGRMSKMESVLFSNPEGRSFNCYIPMPFKKSMKIIARNESDVKCSMLFYQIDYTVGDQHGDDMLYFNAYYHRENPTSLGVDFEILPKIKGYGHFLGTNFSVIANRELYPGAWWGEGEVKIYLDGDVNWPTLCGTGTEDYIGTGWGQGQFCSLYQGCTFADMEKMQFCFYRFHVVDPVYFREDIRVTIQQLGGAGPDIWPLWRKIGKPIYRGQKGMVELDLSEKLGNQLPGFVLFKRQDDWAACAYFYLNKSSTNLPPLEPYHSRIKGLN